jgi:hypothetical protein
MDATNIILGLLAVTAIIVGIRAGLKVKGPVYVHRRCFDRSCSLCSKWAQGQGRGA